MTGMYSVSCLASPYAQSQVLVCSGHAAANPSGQSGWYANSAGSPPTASFQACVAARAAAWCSSPSVPKPVVAKEQTVLGPPFQNSM